MSFFGNNSLLARRKSVAGSGTWNVNANGNWSTPSNWLNGVVPNGADQFADFSKVNLTTTRTVTVDGNYLVGGMSIGDTDTAGPAIDTYSFSGGILTFSNSLGVVNINIDLAGASGSNNRRRVRFNTVIAGTNDLSITQTRAAGNGNGTIAFRTINTFTGNINISSGTSANPIYFMVGSDITTGDNAQLGSGNYSGNISIQGVGIVCFLTRLNNNLSGVLSGPGGSKLELRHGVGITTLSNANAFQGTVDVWDNPNAQPRLQLAHANAIYLAVLNISGNNALLFAPNISIFNVGRLTGTGSFALTNTDNVGITMSVGGTNIIDTYSGVISGLGGIRKIGSNYTLSLTGANTYAGSTSILAGTLRVSGAAINSATASKVTQADFTNTTLTVTFTTAPAAGETYRLFPGSTVQTYNTVTLSGTGVTGRTATYNSANSTLTIN